MKKMLFITMLLITGAGSIALRQGLFSARPAAAAVDLSQLPPDLVVPAALPASIEDPRLLEAWIRLYAHAEPLELWDGTHLTGRDLAQFALDQAIPIIMDVDGYCQKGTCSRQYCAGDTCTYEGGQPGVEPIYVHAAHAADMPALVGTLAHELFHRMQPFGPVMDTRFEEYWAFRIEAMLNPEQALKFDGYDPMVSGYLALWIRDNGVYPYFKLADYPASVAP